MDLKHKITLLTVLSSVMFLAGILLILFAGPLPTIVGALLIIASTIVFLVDVGNVVGYWGGAPGG